MFDFSLALAMLSVWVIGVRGMPSMLYSCMVMVMLSIGLLSAVFAA